MAQLFGNPDEMLEAALAAREGVEAAGLDDGAPVLETGRRIITFDPDGLAEGVASLRNLAPGNVAMSSDFADHDVDTEAVDGASALVFEELGIAVVDVETGIAAAGNELVANNLAVRYDEPEIFMFPSDVNFSEYLRGFAAAAARISADFTGGSGDAEPSPADDPAATVLGATWGINAVRAPTSRFTGAGIKLAILDTGLDFRHPDFAGRPIVSSSFVTGQTPQDGNKHGTHCTGTAAGPKAPPGNTPRYGIAGQALIHIGKVLSNAGSGSSATVLAGMNWAIAKRCEVISMSLGGGGGPYAYYTQAGQAALNARCLIIAAAGNDSNRPGVIRPLGAPANSPTIMSVAALDPNLGVAFYSNGGTLDIAGPGSNVFSSVPMPTRYATLSGTSMATPHVAGCAALLAQSNGALRGATLRTRLRSLARPLPRPPTDVGSGLVQAVQ